jgi:hypothetical protein
MTTERSGTAILGSTDSRLADVEPSGNNDRVIYVQRQKTRNVRGMKNMPTDGIDKRTNELHDVSRTTQAVFGSIEAFCSARRKINFVSISSHVRVAFSSTRCRSAAAYGYLKNDCRRPYERADMWKDGCNSQNLIILRM